MDIASLKTTTIRYNKKPEAAVQYEIVLLAATLYVENNKLHGSARWQVVKTTGATREKVKNNLSDLVCRCGFTNEPTSAAGKSGTIEWNDNKLIEGKEWGMAGVGYPDRFTIVFGELQGSVFTQLARADVHINKERVNIRENLVYCSLFNERRMSWWQASRTWNPGASNEPDNMKPTTGQYALDGYNGFEMFAKPGQMEDLRQQLYTLDSNGYRRSRLKSGTWYTLSFKAIGVNKKTNADGSYTSVGQATIVVYLTNNVSGISTGVIDTSAGVIVDGLPTKPFPYGDMSVLVKNGWTVGSHTITFKTSTLTSGTASAHAPTLYIRSFGEGHAGLFEEEFAEGGAYFRVACIKLEEGQEATAYIPHTTETQSPIYSTAYIRSVTTPSAPSGGSYSNHNPTTTGWSDGIPSDGEGRLWASSAIFYPEASGATWSTPAPMTDTSTSDVEFCPYDGIPSVPVVEVNGSKDWCLAPAGTVPNASMKLWFDLSRNSDLTLAQQEIMKWRAECRIINGKREGWMISKTKGEDGTSFMPKGNAESHFDNEAAFDAAKTAGGLVSGKYYLVDSTPSAKLYLWNGSTAIEQTAENNWAYTTSDYTLWVKNDTKWVSFGKIQGPQGPQGEPGDSAWSYSVESNINSIPVNSQGLPLITSFEIKKKITHGSEIVEDGGKYGLSYIVVANVGGTERQIANGQTTANSLSVNLASVSSNVISKVICNLKYSGSDTVVHTINIYPLKNGSNGEDSMRLDLSNEMDAVVADENGNVSPRSCSTYVSLYKGTEKVMLTQENSTIIASNSYDSNNDCEIDYQPDGTVRVRYGVYYIYGGALTETITVTYNEQTYQADFTIVAQKQGLTGNTGNDAVLYQLNPSETALTFSRGSDGNFTTPSKSISCGLISIVGKKTEVVTTNASSWENLYLYYSLNGGTNYTNSNFNDEITVSNTYESIKFILSSHDYGNKIQGAGIEKKHILDTETIPIVKEGRKGDAGDSTIVEGARGVGVFRRFINGEQLCYNQGKRLFAQNKTLSFNNLVTANKAILIEGQISKSGSYDATVYVYQYESAYLHIMFGNTMTELGSSHSVVSDMSVIAYYKDGNKTVLKTYLVWRLSSSDEVEYDPSKYQPIFLDSIGGYITLSVGGSIKYAHIRFGRSLDTLTKVPEKENTDSSYKMYIHINNNSIEPGTASGGYSDWSAMSNTDYSYYLINNSFSSNAPVALVEIKTKNRYYETYSKSSNQPLYMLIPAESGVNRIDFMAATACNVTDLRVSLLDITSFNEVDGQYLGTYSSNVESAPTNWDEYAWCRFRDPNNIQRVPVPSGNYSPTVVYEATDIISPMVKDGDQYYMMCRSGITQGLSPSEDAALDYPTTWMKVEKWNAVYTEIIMASLGLIGKAVFNGDYMYSQQGYTINKDGKKVDANYGSFGMPDFNNNNAFHPNVFIDFMTGLFRCRKSIIEESTFEECSVTGSCRMGALKMIADRLDDDKVVNCGYITWMCERDNEGYINLPEIKEGEFMKITFYNPLITRTVQKIYVRGKGNATFIVNSTYDKRYSAVDMSMVQFAEFHGYYDSQYGPLWNIIVNEPAAYDYVQEISGKTTT